MIAIVVALLVVVFVAGVLVGRGTKE